MLVAGDKENKQIFIFPSSTEKYTTRDSDFRDESVRSIPGSKR